jgi:hypothetical protein
LKDWVFVVVWFVEESLVKENRWCQMIKCYIFVSELLCSLYGLDSEGPCINDFDVLELVGDLSQYYIIHFGQVLIY